MPELNGVVDVTALPVPTGPAPGAPTQSGLLGYIVLISDESRPGWHDDWDGQVHVHVGAARDSLAQARNAGFEAVLAEQRAMDGE